MRFLLTSLPSEDALQRLLDGVPLPEVARDPAVWVEVIREDGKPQRVLDPGDLR
jgi:hypothetical protein